MNPRFAVYDIGRDKILCRKIWEDSHDNIRYNLLWGKVEKSHFLLLSSSGIDILIDLIENYVGVGVDLPPAVSYFPAEGEVLAHTIGAFLLLNGFDKTSIIVPVKEIGISYTDELIVQGLDFVNGFKI